MLTAILYQTVEVDQREQIVRKNAPGQREILDSSSSHGCLLSTANENNNGSIAVALVPGMPDTLDSSSSRSPRHAAGSDLRFSKEPGCTDTACTRHFFSRVSCMQKRVITSLNIDYRGNMRGTCGFQMTPAAPTPFCTPRFFSCRPGIDHRDDHSSGSRLWHCSGNQRRHCPGLPPCSLLASAARPIAERTSCSPSVFLAEHLLASEPSASPRTADLDDSFQLPHLLRLSLCQWSNADSLKHLWYATHLVQAELDDAFEPLLLLQLIQVLLPRHATRRQLDDLTEYDQADQPRWNYRPHFNCMGAPF